MHAGQRLPPFGVVVRPEYDVFGGRCRDPRIMAQHLFFQLPCFPTGMAHGQQCMGRTVAIGNVTQHIQAGG